MKKHTILILILALLFMTNTANAQTKVKAFASIGSSGVGLGLKYKNATLYTRYYYEYWEVDFTTMRGFIHVPSIGVTYNILNEKVVKLYAGIEYKAKLINRQHFFSRIDSVTNYFLSVPLGIEITPFQKFRNFSFILEAGIELEHFKWEFKTTDWNVNFRRGVVGIRYQLGKRIRG